MDDGFVLPPVLYFLAIVGGMCFILTAVLLVIFAFTQKPDDDRE